MLHTKLFKSFLSGKRENTQRRYTSALDDFCKFIGEKGACEVVSADAVAYISDLYMRNAPDNKRLADLTIKNQFSTLHSIYTYFMEMGLIDRNPFTPARRVISWRQKRHKRPTVLIDYPSVLRVIEDIQPHMQSKRDKAIIAVLFGCGLRRSELLNLRVGDVMVSQKGTLYLKIREAKAGTPRNQPLPEWTWQYLSPLVSERKTVGARADDFIFISSYGLLKGTYPIDARTLARMYNRYFNAAPHSARATFATNLLDAGHSYDRVADALGHSSTRMVAVYDKRERSVDTNIGSSVKYAANS